VPQDNLRLPLGNQKKEPVPGGTPGCPDALTFLTAPGYPGSTVGALREEVIFLMAIDCFSLLLIFSLSAFHCRPALFIDRFSLQASTFHSLLFIGHFSLLLVFSLNVFHCRPALFIDCFSLLLVFSLTAFHCSTALFIDHFSLLLVFSLTAFHCRPALFIHSFSLQ
jgi:hypothetical protein